MGGRNDCWNSKFGTTFGARQWLALDACGSAGISTSFFIHIYALIVIYFYLISNSFFAQMLFILFYLPAAVLAMASLFMAWTTDPGAVPMGARPLVTVKRASSMKDDADDSTTATAPSSPTNDNDNIKKKKRQRERGIRRCNKCNDNFKPARAHHDSVTGRCIVKFDHYCPWVGNAVGALNHKFFVLFIGYTMCTTLLSFVLLLVRAIHCGYYAADSSDSGDVSPNAAKEEEEGGNMMLRSLVGGNSQNINFELESLQKEAAIIGSSYQDGQECVGVFSSVAVIVLMFVSLTFLIFTCCMFVEQIEAVQTNTGKIARMKMRVGQGGTELARVTEEFNEMFGGNTPNVTWHWFLPIPVSFPPSMRKVVLGYEWDDSIEPVPYKEPSNSCDDSSSSNNEQKTLETSLSSTPDEIERIDVPAVASLSNDNDNGSKPGDGRKIKKRTNSRGTMEVESSPTCRFVDKTNPIY